MKKLSLTRTYMLRLIDEDAKAFEPLRKYLALPKDDPARAEHMDSALRVACFIPTEVMYTAAQTAETLRSLADQGREGRDLRRGRGDWSSAARRCAPRG